MVRTASQRRSFTSNPNNNDVMQIDNVSISRKTKFRYILARCDNYEKQIADLLQSLSLYTRRTAKLRDSGDCVSDSFSTLASAEAVNPTFKHATVELSKTLRSIQDHRDSEVLYFEQKLLTSLSQYGENLQKQKEKIRASVPKVIDSDKGRNSMWMGTSGQPSTSQNRRRSQSADRIERISKEERDLQRQVQHYEFQKNLVLKKLMLRFLLTELRLTIKSLNSLTLTYQNILRDFSPQNDLRAFNEFFNFRAIKKSLINEIQEDVSDIESTNDDDDDDEDDDDDGDDEQHESGLEENPNSVDDVTEAPDDDDDDNSESWKSESISSSTQSTLRRFNSTPDMEGGRYSGGRQNQADKKKELPPITKNNLLIKSINDKVRTRNQARRRTNNNKNFKSDDDNQDDSDEDDEQHNADEDRDDDDDDDDGDNKDRGNKNNKRRSIVSRPSSVRTIRKQFK